MIGGEVARFSECIENGWGDEAKKRSLRKVMNREGTKDELSESLGLLSEDDLKKLRAAGLQRVHCNIETAPSLFPSLCTTHTTEDKLTTLRAAKKLGFQICCGGIIGMGETDEQLVEFAFALKEIAPDSIPVNVLHPIEGTPLAGRGILDPERVVDSVAILRLVNPSTPLRFAGGRRASTLECRQASQVLFSPRQARTSTMTDTLPSAPATSWAGTA